MQARQPDANSRRRMNIEPNTANFRKRKRLFELAGGKCEYCNEQLSLEEFQLDHFVPRNAGGKDSKNVVVSCVNCNQLKSGYKFEDKEHVRRYITIKNRTSKVRILRAGVQQKTEMAEVLQCNMPDEELVEQTRNCREVEEIIKRVTTAVTPSLPKKERPVIYWDGR